MRAFHVFSVVLAALACLGWQTGAGAKEPVEIATLGKLKHRMFESLAICPDGKTVAAAADGEIMIWDLTTHEQRASLIAPKRREIHCLAYTPDGKYILAGTTDGDKAFDRENAENTVDVWDVAAAKIVRKLTGHHDLIYDVAVSPDGKTAASVSRDETVRLWDLAAGKTLHTLAGVRYDAGRLPVRFSPDGKLLAAGGKGVLLWEVATGKQYGKLEERGMNAIVSLAFAPDGKTLATGNWNTALHLWDVEENGDATAQIHLWDVARLERRTRPAGLGQGDHVAFSADGKMLYVAGTRVAERSDTGIVLSHTGTLQCWDIAMEKQTAAVEWNGSGWFIQKMALTPDGKTLAVASDSEVKLWNVAADD